MQACIPTYQHHNRLPQLHKGRNPNQNLPLCYLHLVLSPAPTSAQDGLDPLQLALVVFLHGNLPIYGFAQTHMGAHGNLH